MRIHSTASLLVLALAAPFARPALAQSVPANPGFEEGAPELMGFHDNLGERPIAGRTGWQAYEIVGDVAADARDIQFGMLLVGAAQAWVDQASFEVVGDAAPVARSAPVAPPRPVTERGLENLAAFTRLLGYVRFFHPSDQAAATDWNAFAVAGCAPWKGRRTPRGSRRCSTRSSAPSRPPWWCGWAPRVPRPRPAPVATPSAGGATWAWG
jgi:hypothetical protein